MSKTLRFTLLSEGSSDRALLPILKWAVSQHVSASVAIDGWWVDTSRLPPGKISTPRNRLRSAVEVYPCDIIFLHRDEDGSGWEHRNAEIDGWLAEAELENTVMPIPVIPICKSEAWLLIDEDAVRAASGNPRGNVSLNLPRIHEIEGIANPKQSLFDALATASELSGRRLKRFDKYRARLIVADHMSQHIHLRQLTAFQRLETKIATACNCPPWV